MDAISIYRGSDLLIDVKPDDVSVQEKGVMGVNEIRMRVKMSIYVDFQIGDYCDVFGERYFIHYLPDTVKTGRNAWEYSLNMQSYVEKLKFRQYMFYGDDNTIKETEFSLNGKAADFLNVLITNMNRDDSGWSIGECDDTLITNLTFSAQSCYDVLKVLAETFATEWWVVGKKISLAKKRLDTGFVFEHGKNKGLYTITRTNISDANLITRLIVFGSDRNLPSNYRNYQKRLLMTGGLRYLEKNTGLYGIREAVQIFDDVYPHRDGLVTGVDAGNPFVFTDSTIDFDVNTHLLPGLTAKITFNSGQLTGYTFDISSFDLGTKTFTILKNNDEKNLDVPSDVLRPAIGDAYVIVDIQMPTTYYTFAEDYLKAKAQKFIEASSVPQISYQVVTDPKFMNDYDREVTAGNLVFIVDDQFNVNRKIPIMNAQRNIVRENQYTLTLADSVDKNPLDDVINIAKKNFLDLLKLNQRLKGQALLNGTIIRPLSVSPGSGINLSNIPTVDDTTGLPQLFLDGNGNIVRHG